MKWIQRNNWKAKTLFWGLIYCFRPKKFCPSVIELLNFYLSIKFHNSRSQNQNENWSSHSAASSFLYIKSALELFVRLQLSPELSYVQYPTSFWLQFPLQWQYRKLFPIVRGGQQGGVLSSIIIIINSPQQTCDIDINPKWIWVKPRRVNYLVMYLWKEKYRIR